MKKAKKIIFGITTRSTTTTMPSIFDLRNLPALLPEL